MASPEVGDTISVTRSGLRVTEVRGGRIWVEDTATGKVRSYYESEVVVLVTKKADKRPKNWPPQEGDVWHSKDYAKSLHVLGGSVYRRLLGSISSPMSYEQALGSYPDMRLIYRKF